jgi:hypothetical protein
MGCCFFLREKERRAKGVGVLVELGMVRIWEMLVVESVCVCIWEIGTDDIDFK